MSLSFICDGMFNNVASTPYFLPLQQKISFFELTNFTRMGITANGIAGSGTSSKIVKGFFRPTYMTAGTAEVGVNGSYANNIAALSVGVLPINGFTLYDSSVSVSYPVVAISSFTPGTTTVWTTGNAHGLSVGDNVRVFSLTSAPQFGGLNMTVTAVGSTTTFTTLLDSTGATTSVGSMQKTGNSAVMGSALYFPQNRVIAKITNANPMVVTTLIPQNYQVGDVCTFDIPAVFGVPQLSAGYNGLPFNATITAVNNAVGTQTVTFGGVDSTNFGVFATNSSATVTNPGHWLLAPGYPFTFPTLVPEGEGNINQIVNVVPQPLPYANQDVLSFARQNQASRGILVGAGDGTASSTTGGLIGSDVCCWYYRAFTSTMSFPDFVGQ